MHVRIRRQDNVFVNQAGAGNRRPAGVNRALNGVLGAPSQPLPRGCAVLTLPSPTSPSNETPASASDLKSSSTISMFDHRAPPALSHAARPECANARCAVMAMAFRPTTSSACRICTSPAEIMVVTPPAGSFQSSQADSGEASNRPPRDARGCNQPGAAPCQFASMIGSLLQHPLRFLCPRPRFGVNRHDGICIEEGRCKSPLRSSPIFRITSLLCASGFAAGSWDILALPASWQTESPSA